MILMLPIAVIMAYRPSWIKALPVLLRISLTGARDGRVRTQGAAPQQPPRDPRFQVPLDNGTVSLGDVVAAGVYASPFLTSDAERRAVGQHYYPLLNDALQKHLPGAQMNVLRGGAGLGVCLPASEDAELELVIYRNTIRYDWTASRLLLLEANELDDEATQWVPPEERRSLRLQVYGIVTQLQTAIARENRHHTNRTPSVLPAPVDEERDLQTIRPQLERARQRLEQEAQRFARLTYAKGMAGGMALLSCACAALGAIFVWQHIAAENGVPLLAGGVGACVSVLQRMTRGSLKLDYKSDRDMLRLFGGVRPWIGGIFGIVVFCALKATLVSELTLPAHTAPQLAAVVVFSFAAGFNERWAQDMLRTAGHQPRE